MLPIKIDNKQGLITWNFEAVKADLETQLKKYDDVVIDFEDITEYTNTRANLNKVSKVIDDERKRIKKEYSLPLVAFEKEIKELVSMVDVVSKKIDKQLKEYEEERKEEKRAVILEFIENLDSKHDITPYFDERWLNKTYTREAWEADIQAILYKLDNRKYFVVTTQVLVSEEQQELLSKHLENETISIYEYEVLEWEQFNV